MMILLSPAKNLDFKPAPLEVAPTEPAFAKEAMQLIRTARKLTRDDLRGLMDISDDLADLNWRRYRAFRAAPEPDMTKPAVLAFNGDVYQGLSAKTLVPSDLEWAQAHLRILSGLYGLLRPLDAIQPYRLEMGSRLATKAGPDLYAFWGKKIAKALAKETDRHDCIVNLASEEYFGAVDRKALARKVVTPTFKEIKDGRARPIFMFVKRARGLMARFAIENRIEDPEGLKEFNVGGYRFDTAASSADEWSFTRPQPPPAART